MMEHIIVDDGDVHRCNDGSQCTQCADTQQLDLFHLLVLPDEATRAAAVEGVHNQDHAKHHIHRGTCSVDGVTANIFAIAIGASHLSTVDAVEHSRERAQSQPSSRDTIEQNILQWYQ